MRRIDILPHSIVVLLTRLAHAVVLIVIMSVACRARDHHTWDAILSGGTAFQFATVVNDGWNSGIAAHGMIAYQVQVKRRFSIWVAYDMFRTGSEGTSSRDEVQAEYWSCGMRSNLISPFSGAQSFFLIGFGFGSSRPSVVQNSTPSLRNTAMQFGVGIPIQVHESFAAVPMVRCIIGANSGFTIPLTIGIRWSIQ